MHLKKPILYMVIGLAALLVVVGAGGGTAFMVMKSMPASEAPANAAAGAALVDLEQNKTVPLKEFKTHLADASSARYVAITFELVAKDGKNSEKIQKYNPLIRDSIVVILNSKKSSELTGDQALAKLKTEVLEKVNGLLGDRIVLQVLITDVVVQF